HEQIGRAPNDVDGEERGDDPSPARWAVAHRQRKNRTASAKQTVHHTARMASSPRSACHPPPWSMTPRSPSTTAVSGSACTNGCTTAGKFDDEKNTPDATHIGTITRFIHPDAPSMVLARAAM